MDLTLHCKLCDHKIMDFKTGTLCGLTNKKPDFQNKCGVIKMQDNFETQIKDVNIEYETVLKTKTDTYGHLIIYSIVAVTLVLGGFLLGKYIFEKGVISTGPLIIMTVGLAVFAFAYAPLNLYNTNLKIANKKKEILDNISKMYGYDYNINITHLKDSLDNKSYRTDLKIRRTNNSI